MLPTSMNHRTVSSSSDYVDDRLSYEPKYKRKLLPASKVPLLTWLAVMLVCYTLQLQEQLYAFFTSVRCEPPIVRAGTNVTCAISTFQLAHETDLSITQLGTAGPIVALSTQPHAYRVRFSTAKAGGAGVRVQHVLASSWSMVEVLPGPAVGRVEVGCEPRRVAVGEEVRCTVVPRDRFGNHADVEKPADAPADYFSVRPTGGAGKVTVYDTYVSFAAVRGPLAGVVVTLGSARVEAQVDVE